MQDQQIQTFWKIPPSVLMGEEKERVIIKIAAVRKDGVYNKVKRLNQ